MGIGNIFNKATTGISNSLWSQAKAPLTSAMLGFASKALNPDGNKTDFSEFGNTVGDLISFIPGIGTVVGLGIKGLTALTDAAFGSNVNEPAIADMRSQIKGASNNIGSALSQDTLIQGLKDLNGIDVAGANLGTQGWFNHDVDNARNSLLTGKQAAHNYSQFAIDNIQTLGARNMIGNALADGGNIHIKDSKKGTFQALATRKGMSMSALSRDIQAHPDNYSSAAKKKEVFYRNFAHKHDTGGPIFGTDYDMNLTFINNGGSHEENPYGGVFMGIAPDGQPNQVEEGEVIFNDYAYSDRLKVPKAVRNKYKLRETKEWTFADALEDYIKKNGIEERNNDPIANRGLEAFASELAMEQELVRAKKKMKESRKAANGGHLYADGDFIIFDKSYKGYDELYDPSSAYMQAREWLNAEENKAERDALIERIINGDFGDVPENRYQDVRDNWYTLARDNKKGPVHNALMDFASKKAEAAANMRATEPLPELSDNNTFANGVVGIRALNKNKNLDNTSAVWNYAADKGGLHYNPSDVLPGSSIEERSRRKTTKASENEDDGYDPAYWLAGLGANVAGLMSTILDPYRPQMVNVVDGPNYISPRYLGDYLTYNPYDINYATSQQDTNSAATRRAIMQSASPSRNAALLANDFNANATRGATRRQALEYNDALRQAVANFNRGTNQFNVQMYTDAATKNQAAKQAYFQNKLNQAQYNSQLDFRHKVMKDQAIGQNLTAIGDWFDALRRENVAKKGAGVFASIMNTPNDITWDYLSDVLGISKKSKKNG